MDIRTAILDSAEARMRVGGFHVCSFRAIATDVGIKSASVHHHFPTKQDLGAALVARYTARVLAVFGDPEDDRSLARKLEDVHVLFRASLARGDGMCLCGGFATETPSLPPPVASGTRLFFAACNDWLRRAFACADVPRPEQKALQVTALLQGAMLQALSLGDVSAFDEATEGFASNRPTPQARRRRADAGSGKTGPKSRTPRF
jgi:TetR/AcrR family transcriptional regulator, transcriptional repressor for nem operon